MFDWFKRRKKTPGALPDLPPSARAYSGDAPLRIALGSAESSLLLGVTMAQEGRFAEALIYFEHVTMKTPENPDGHAYLGQVLAVLKRDDEALRAFGEALRLDPDHGHALLERGLLHQRRSNRQQAIADYTLAIERAKEREQQFKARYNRALLYEEADDIERAEPEYQAILDLEPGYPPASNSLATICLQRGVALRDTSWVQAAVNILTVAIKAHPDDLICRLRRGQAFAVVGLAAEARADLQAALRSDSAALRAQAQSMLDAIKSL